MRISTGVEGLDEMLNGGLLPNRTYLLKGGLGTGKTTLGIQFILAGAKNGERTMYITLEEPAEEIIEDIKLLGFDLEKFPDVHIFDASPFGETALFGESFYSSLELDMPGFKAALESKIEQIKPSRIVLDPITLLALVSKNEVEYRRDVLSLFKLFRDYGVTTLLISEHTKEYPEDFLVSGVIEYIVYEVNGKTIRGIRIKKMRGTSFDEQVRPYRITSEGIKVYNEESLFE